MKEQVCANTYPVGPNCWFRRIIFDEGFRYDPTIGPDGSMANRKKSGSELEFFVRLTNAGEKIVYVPTAIVFHRIQEHQLTYSYLLRRAYAGGRGWAKIYNPWQDFRKIGGIPIFLFKKVTEETVSLFLDFFRGKNHLEPLMQLFQYLGAIAEYRTMYVDRQAASKKFSD